VKPGRTPKTKSRKVKAGEARVREIMRMLPSTAIDRESEARQFIAAEIKIGKMGSLLTDENKRNARRSERTVQFKVPLDGVLPYMDRADKAIYRKAKQFADELEHFKRNRYVPRRGYGKSSRQKDELREKNAPSQRRRIRALTRVSPIGPKGN